MQQNLILMKLVVMIAFFLLSIPAIAQKPCEISEDVTDSIGTYKTTKDYLLYEKVFAGNSKYIFASLVLTDGKPTLKVQFIEKSKDFIKANCVDANSRIYIQLLNGKIVSLSQTVSDNCGTMLRDDKGFNNRILSAEFGLNKLNYGTLQASPISFIRIKFLTATEDYVLKKTLTSELDGTVYEPENYFINYLHCIE